MFRYSFDGAKISNFQDDLYKTKNETDFSKLIYNGIIDYSYRNNDIDVYDYSTLYRALKTRLKFDTSNEEYQKKHGFYGDIILYLLLMKIYQNGRIVSRGYFYSILDNGETKGFDAFHFLELKDELQLWMGESKFREGYKQGIDEILSKLRDTFSNSYIEKNILAIFEKFDYWDDEPIRLSELRKKWLDNPIIDLVEECKSGISITYPCMIIYERKKSINDDDMIKEVIKYIDDYCDKNSITINSKLTVNIFFAFLPIDSVSDVKGRVIKWIKNQEQLI